MYCQQGDALSLTLLDMYIHFDIGKEQAHRYVLKLGGKSSSGVGR
jgi:hypothetical protein